MGEIEASIDAEIKQSGKGTFLHAFCSGRAALWKRELQIKYLGERDFYPLEAKLMILAKERDVKVWAAFECDRNMSVDPKNADIDQTQSSGPNDSCITTHAVGLGEQVESGRDFIEQITAALQSFLHAGNGEFELIQSL